MNKKNIFISIAVHLVSLWHRGLKQLGNSLLHYPLDRNSFRGLCYPPSKLLRYFFRNPQLWRGPRTGHSSHDHQNICLSWKQLREKNRKTAYTYIPIAIFNFVRNYSTLLAFANLPSPRPLTLRTKTQQYHVQHGGKYRKNTAQTLIGILPCFWSLNLAQKTRTFIAKTLNHGMSHVRLSARESF